MTKTRALSNVLARLFWLCMTPLVLLAAWQAWNHASTVEAQDRSEARNKARNFATDIDRFLDARLKALNILALSPLLDDDRRWPELYHQALAFQHSFGAHVAFADAQGRMIFNTRQPFGVSLPDLVQHRGHPGAEAALRTGQPRIGDVFHGPLAGTSLVAVVVPVVREGKATKVVVSGVEVSQFQEAIDRLSLPAGWSIAMRDGLGQDIARRSPPGFDSARDADADHRFAFGLKHAAWSVVLEVPRSVLQARQREVLLSLGALVLLPVGLSLTGGLLASRRIGRQVAVLGQGGAVCATPLEIAELEAARRRIVDGALALEASQGRLQLWGEAFQRAEVGIAIGDAPSNTLLAVNATFARQRGFTEDELAGRASQSLFPTDRAADLSAFWQTLESRNHGVFESEHLRKDGSRFPVLIDVTVLRDESGTAVTRLAFVLDISERNLARQERAARQAEALEAQRQARVAALNLMDDALAARWQAEASADELRKLSMAVDQSAESIVITDLEIRITYVNESFLRQTGYARDELIGRNPRILKSGKTPREAYEALWSALRQGQTWRGELHNRRKDGTEFIEFSIISPIRSADGTVTHYVAVKEDITERKRMGAELDRHRHQLEQMVAERTVELEQAREQADAANRAKSAFLANMSHEIRTPMNAILGFAHLLRRDASSSRDAERLDKIEDAAKHLLTVINDILDLSKIEAGKVELESHDFALEAVLDHVATLIADSAAAKGWRCASTATLCRTGCAAT